MKILMSRKDSTSLYNKKYQSLTLLWMMVIILSAVPMLRNMLNSSPYISLVYWGAVVFSMIFWVQSMHPPGKSWQYDHVKAYAISGAIAYIAIGFLLGVLLKKLKASPYDQSLAGILLNAATIFPPLIAREMIRSYSIGTAWRKFRYRHTGIVIITIIMALSEINFGKISQIKNYEDLVIFIVSDVSVAFSKNILASVLVFYGGSGSSIRFFGILEAFKRGFPFLPELPWLAIGAIGIIFPLVFAMFLSESCKSELEHRRPESPQSNIAYLTALFLSVLFAWFCVGVFPLYPSVILTGSMEPQIQVGDVVVIRKMLVEEDINNLKVDDIINFQREDINITHRIDKIFEDEAGNLSFQTKGDNNQSVDQILVLPNDIKGIVVKVVPKVGIPVLLIKGARKIPEGVIDYEQRTIENTNPR